MPIAPKSEGASRRASTRLTTNCIPIMPKRSMDAHIVPFIALLPNDSVIVQKWLVGRSMLAFAIGHLKIVLSLIPAPSDISRP